MNPVCSILESQAEAKQNSLKFQKGEIM